MSKIKELGVSLTIKGKHFQLVQNPKYEGLDCCDHCALLGDPCGMSGKQALTSLCCIDDEETNTFFMESSNDIEVHGILNQEIVISALSALREAEEKRGNEARAQVAGKLIALIG